MTEEQTTFEVDFKASDYPDFTSSKDYPNIQQISGDFGTLSAQVMIFQITLKYPVKGKVKQIPFYHMNREILARGYNFFHILPCDLERVINWCLKMITVIGAL